jgi:hypothetical protein
MLDHNYYRLKLLLDQPEKNTSGEFKPLSSEYALCNHCKEAFESWLEGGDSSNDTEP